MLGSSARAATDAAIETHNLAKQFASGGGWRRLSRPITASAVEDVSLRVEWGELFGLLGPNGAGKTTLVKMLCTLVLPSRGSAIVAGFPLERASAIRSVVGLMVTDDRSFYWRLSGRENLTFFAALHRIHGAQARRRVDEVLAQVAMEQYADRRFSEYSTGMKQRLALARCLLHRPKILFLDEPSRSLDPAATRKLHELLQRLIQEWDVTIFLITHDLSEAEKLCERVAVMSNGSIRTIGEPASLRKKLAHTLRYDMLVDHVPGQAVAELKELVSDLSLEASGSQIRLRFTLTTSNAALTTLLDRLRRQDVTMYSIESQAPSLEEVFTHYTRVRDD